MVCYQRGLPRLVFTQCAHVVNIATRLSITENNLGNLETLPQSIPPSTPYLKKNSLLLCLRVAASWWRVCYQRGLLRLVFTIGTMSTNHGVCMDA